MNPILVLAEFVFTEDGEAEFLPYLDRTLKEIRDTDGCLQAVVWNRPGRRYQFSTLWSYEDAVEGWVMNEFHTTILMPSFRKWCVEGCFGEYVLSMDHERARKCASCGRWTKDAPGWNESHPNRCARCAEQLAVPQYAVGE